MFLLYSFFSKSFQEILNGTYFVQWPKASWCLHFFLPDISVSFPDIPFGAGPISNWDFYLNSTLFSQICVIACLKTKEMF